MIDERQPDDRPLPAGLQQELREWVDVARTVSQNGGPEQYEAVRLRGRRLYARIADARGHPVEFIDPTTGAVESIPVRVAPPVPPTPLTPPGETPWASGLAVAGFTAVFVTIGDVALSRAFADAFGLLWVPANLLVGLGFAPSLHLLRRVPFWRWPAMGTAAGLAAAWVVLLLGLLG